MTMSRLSKRFCGIILLTVPRIQYGGYFLLMLLASWDPLPLTDFQRSMFRAGHAHAGTLVILALVAQLLADHARLSTALNWSVRTHWLSAGANPGQRWVFRRDGGVNITQPTGLIAILYVGIGVLALSAIALGIGLIKNR